MPHAQPRKKAILVERVIMQLLFDPRRSKKTADGGRECSGLSYSRIASLLGIHKKTVRNAIAGPRGLIAQGLIRATAVISGKQRVDTVYSTNESVIMVQHDSKAVLKEILVSLNAQLASLDEARNRTIAAIDRVRKF